MKDSEFLELLNLYLDHEISAADAARLEAEVQANPKRRSVYQEYCRMQKACTLLAKDFADQPADRKVVNFEPRRSAWNPGLLAVGGLALAAACVALVLVKRAPTAATNPAAPAQTTLASTSEVPVTPTAKAPEAVAMAPAPTEAATVITHAVTTVPTNRAESRPLLASLPLTLDNANARNAEGLRAVAQQNGQAQFEWMRNMQLAPIQQPTMDEARLDARSVPQPANRTYSTNRPPAEGKVEWVAFKYHP